MIVLVPSPSQKSRFPFDWRPDVSRGALDFSLNAVTGQAATYSRASTGIAADSNGDPITIGYSRPRLEWGTLDFNDSVESVGVRLNADALSFPFLLAPRAMTVYARFQRAGGDNPSAVVLAIGGVSGGRLVIAESAASGYTATYHNGTTAYTSTVTQRLVLRDHVEVRAVLTTSSLTLYQSVAGGTEETGSASGALTLGTSWTANTIYIGANAAAANPAHNVFARVAVARGTVAIGAFRPAARTGYTPPVSIGRETEAGVGRVTEAGVSIVTEGT